MTIDPNKAYNIEPVTKEFHFLSAQDLSELPDMEWRVDGVLPAQGAACIYGPSGVGKSFLCLDLAAAIAEGRDWFGHKTCKAEVAFLALEGQSGIRNRVAAWEEHNKRPYPEGVSFSFTDFELNTVTDPAKMLAAIKRSSEAKVVIIDTLNRAMPGSDENGSQAMSQAILGTSMLQRGTGGLVIVVHHPGKDISKKLRGHSSLHAALDTILEVKAEKGTTAWRILKSKDGDSNISHRFNLTPVECISTWGREFKSCVVTEETGKRPPERTPPKGANQIAVHEEVLRILVDQRVAAVGEGNLEAASLGMPLVQVQAQIAGLLIEIGVKHRKQRAVEALDSLITKGHFVKQGDMLGLPVREAQ